MSTALARYRPDGSLDPAFAYALQLVEATVLYRAGGAAAVAALAYGTRSVARVDKIVGPGNSYTAAAKWLVSADVGIDALQGPSELVAIASGDADAVALALDLLAQAEHGAGAFAALISDDAGWLRVVADAIGATHVTRIRGYRTRDLDAAVHAVNDAAPEHVLLAGRRAAAQADRVDRAGAVFVGTRSAVAFGDYVAERITHSRPEGRRAGPPRCGSTTSFDGPVGCPCAANYASSHAPGRRSPATRACGSTRHPSRRAHDRRPATSARVARPSDAVSHRVATG